MTHLCSPVFLLATCLSFPLALLPLVSSGQCIVSNLNALNSDPTNAEIGQSFTPTCNGLIEYVEIFTTLGGTNTAGTLRIYDGSTVTSTPIHTQPVPAITVNPGEAVRVYLTAAVAATFLQKRTFEMDMSLEIPFSGGNPYSGGRLFYNGTNSSVYANSDIKFNVSIISNCDDSFASLTANACNAYTSPSGLLWDSTGVYMDTIPNMAGCDSLITVDLTLTTLDTTVTLNGTEVIANEANATSYQWLDCDNGNAPIPDADEQTFLAPTNGNYAVEITVGNCTAVSECLFVGSTGLAEGDMPRMAIWPNPSSGIMNISGPFNGSHFTIKGALGQDVRFIRTGDRLELVQATPGIYFLQVRSENGTSQSLRFLVR